MPIQTAASGRPRTETHRIVDQNLGLVRSLLARRFPFLAADPDRHADAYTEGCLGLLRAAELYDPVKGGRFSTYATACITGAVLRYLRGERMQGRIDTVSLDALIPGSEDTAHWEMIPDPNAVSPEAALIASGSPERFERMLTRLENPRHREVIRAVYEGGEPMALVAARLGVSRQRCDAIHQAALRCLRERPRRGGTAPMAATRPSVN